MSNPNTAKFPSVADLDLLVASDNAQTSLAASMLSTDTTMTVASGAGFQVPCVAWVDGEAIILPTAAVAGLFSGITRGAQGTTAAAHLNAAAVYGFLSAWHHNQAAAEIKAIEAAYATGIPVGGIVQPVCRHTMAQGLAAGDTDLYTVPAGKRAFIGTAWAIFNGGTAGCPFFFELKPSGSSTYYRISAPITAATGASSTNNVITVLEAGDTIAVNIASVTGTGPTVYGLIIEFSGGSIKAPRLLGLASGDNTLYTCPAGKTALAAAITNASSAAGTGNFTADPGGTRTFKTFLVPSGQTNTAIYQYGATRVLTAGTNGNLGALAVTLGPGDSFVINVDVGNAAQFAFISITEF